jgi:hypothetical protein
MQLTHVEPYSTDKTCAGDIGYGNPAWRGIDIEYRHNRYGFRGQDWPVETPLSASLGCSCTYGVGVGESQTWSSHLGVEMNLGEGAAGQEVCIHYLDTVLRQGHRIHTLYYLEPTAGRRYLGHYDRDHVDTYSVHSRPNIASKDIVPRKYWIRTAMHPRVLSVMTRTTRLALYGLSQRYSFAVWMISIDDPRLNPKFFDRGARDGAHPGPAGHQWLADNFQDLAQPVEHFLD